MKVLLVFAHPEPRSLNGALRDVAVQELEAQGHEVRVSDLYADGWKSEVDRADFPSLAPNARFKPSEASGEAFAANVLTQDVRAEQAKLLWADVLILQFPRWWHHAGDPQGLDRSGVRLRLRLWRRRAQRQAMG